MTVAGFSRMAPAGKRQTLVLPVLAFFATGLVAGLMFTGGSPDSSQAHLAHTETQHHERTAPKKVSSLAVQTDSASGLDKCGPFLIGIGAQKGGTTEVFHYLKRSLSEHFTFSYVKELHFFDKRTLKFDNIHDQVDNYFKFFNITWESYPKSYFKEGWVPCEAPDGQVKFVPTASVGKPWVEITPSYMYDPAVPPRIFGMFGQGPRFIAVMRNPVKRVLSHINMDFRKRHYKYQMGFFNTTDPPELSRKYMRFAMSEYTTCITSHPQLTKAEAMSECYNHDLRAFGANPFARDGVSILWRGLYGEHMKFWWKLYHPSQFMIFNSEEFYVDMARHYKKLMDWLGTPIDETALYFPPRKGERHEPYVVEAEQIADLMEELTEFFKPYNIELISLLEQNGHGDVAADVKKHFYY